ncbi:CRISPR-associated RAMP protein, Cmr1 family [Ammonifex degensii KC4]|uniref:CRISPR-associated RAMP protein, Cmr1 family n=1 Tax=Ammonifex degensii (strain DSM 10501 / KC4) TaxID=429009 RepID=C9RCS1_AMMDK|nr:type III-B CRISPR module RAMP protein Cmr1 [Ammonifex degensii]ACX52048.1 CRISPR-associated RAMP protein, Cmr1 family [Ammonifex degensii KC4]
MRNKQYEWHLKALTDIWTGDVDRESKRLILTGLLGSIRWWFEVLVRGLGGKACDPTVDGVRCPDEKGHRCVVCKLFGCTGWARKFRLMVLSENGDIIQNRIQAGQTFILRFIPLRPIHDEEWCLLDATLRLIANYGAMGGKTVFKPSDEEGRERVHHHQDFGIVQYVQGPKDWKCTKTLEDIKAYVTGSHWRQVPHSYRDSQGREHDFSWASLQNFWCVKGRYLARQDANTSSFNFVIGRPEPKNVSSQGDSWLAGKRPDRQRNVEPESKKVFSFKEPEAARRTFGFVQDKEGFSPILQKLEILRDGDGDGRQPDPVWSDFDPDTEFMKGNRILKELFSRREGE